MHARSRETEFCGPNGARGNNTTSMYTQGSIPKASSKLFRGFLGASSGLQESPKGAQDSSKRAPRGHPPDSSKAGRAVRAS